MKTNKILMLATFSFVAIFVIVVAIVGLPQFITAWFITDVIVGMLLYVGYLVSTLKYGPSKIPYSKHTLRV